MVLRGERNPPEAGGWINLLNQSFLAKFMQQTFHISRADAQSGGLKLLHHLLRGHGKLAS